MADAGASNDEVRSHLPRAKRIVVKVGSALVAAPPAGIFGKLSGDIARARARGCEVVVVSSGSIALGFEALGIKRRPREVALLQAAAAIGQPELMWRWRGACKRHGQAIAQVLLTHADLADRERFLNARRALQALLKAGVVPVINENDSVATDEIRVGDNDRLSAHVASLVDAELLVILTSVDGLYSGNPEVTPTAERIAYVRHPDDVAAMAGEAGSDGLGVGGMRTKVEAARLAASRAIGVVIASGKRPQALTKVLTGADVGTFFRPTGSVTGRKHWIAYTLKAQGTLTVDAGAARAVVQEHKSLLPSGLVQVDGDFERGAMVEIAGPDGTVARGLVAYDADELRKLQGRQSSEIATILGYMDIPEIVHRDDLVLV